MKSTIAAAILAFASTSIATALRPAYFANGTAVEKRQDDQICVHIGGDPAWYYTFSGVWGSDTGRGPQIPTMFCVSANGAGGAMYIGPDPNPGPGSTKLECQFPAAGQANCDISLVDGYSLSVNCQADGQTIGGDVNLYTTGIACPDQQGPNCINTQSYVGQESAVDAFFQPAIQNGNQYCIFNNCAQDYYFNVADGISCSVSGGM